MTWPKKWTKTKTKTFRGLLQRAIPVTCDIWDTDYISDNWEPEFMTIFVIWQLIVTLDSIRNSCDVYTFWHSFWMVWGNACECDNACLKFHFHLSFVSCNTRLLFTKSVVIKILTQNETLTFPRILIIEETNSVEIKIQYKLGKH